MRFNTSTIMMVDRRHWRDSAILSARILAVTAWVVLALPGLASAALSVTASPTSVSVGQPVSVTISSSGCNVGATISVNFGDGSPPITIAGNATVSVAHAYSAAGTFTIIANSPLCSPPSASVTVTVNPAQVISLAAAPSPAQIGQPVTFTVGGTGTCGGLTLTFGDGTGTGFANGGFLFPLTTTHAYSIPGTFTATATGTGNCTGSASTIVTVNAPPGVITALTATPSPAQIGQPVTFTVSGTGTCGRLTLTFGDATSTNLSGAFPLTTTHAYSGPGTFTATASGTVSCTGSTSASVTVVPLPPFSVSVSVITTPAPAQVSQIQSVPVPITYIFTTNFLGTLSLNSPDGTFIASGGATLGTGGAGLSVTIIGGRGIVTETLTVPQVVAERSLHTGSPTLNFQRVFSGSGVSVTAVAPMRVVSSAVGPFSLRRVELRFENGRGEITVPKNFEKLKAIAIVEFNGSGLLEAEWEVDGRTLAIIREFLTFGSQATLVTPEIPPLPTFEPGLHQIGFRITTPPATFEIPTIGYFVIAAAPPPVSIALIAQAEGTRLSKSPVTFEWKGVPGVTQYRIEIAEVGGEATVFSALATASPYTMPTVYERRFVIGKRYRWQVKGLDVEGNVVAVSLVRTFTWATKPAPGSFVPREVPIALKISPAEVVAEVIGDVARRFTLRALPRVELSTRREEVVQR
jgi:hypothetical protein